MAGLRGTATLDRTCTGHTHVWTGWPVKAGMLCLCGKRLWDYEHRSERLNAMTVAEQRELLTAGVESRERES